MKEKLKKIFFVWSIVLYTFSDLILLLKYSLSSQNQSIDNQKAILLLNIHSIEKGLSFEFKKESWGGGKALGLQRELKSYIDRNGIDSVVINGINVLNKYLADGSSSKDKVVVDVIRQFLEEYKQFIKDGLGGLQVVSHPRFESSFEQVLEFFTSRHSIRSFSMKDITEEEILNAKRIANTTPTACNRQTSRIYCFKDKMQMKLILDNQLGDQGWCLDANCLFVVTSSLSYFNATYERHQALIDGGLFAMNFCMGLHAQKLGTCFKMYVREPKRDREFRNICSIPEAEVPIVLILAGHFPDKEMTVPLSFRF